MATLSPAGQPVKAAPTMALPFLPACLPAPRPGASPGKLRPTARGLVPLTQRSPRECALALAAAGFPGLSLDLEHERATVDSQITEGELSRIGLAYLHVERSVGAPPLDQGAAVAEMLRQIDQPRPPLVRVELMGPISLALQMVDEQERPLAYSPPLREAIVQHLTLRAAWLHDQIGAQLGVVICLDEPFLEAIDSPFCPIDRADGVDLLARALADMPAPRGLCIAGSPNWAEILTLPADLVCCDAFEHGAGLIGAADAVAAFLKRGGAIAWGVVPTDPSALVQERVETLARRFESTAEYLAAAGNLSTDQIRAAALISTSGNLAHLPADLAAHAVTLCGEVSAYLRARYRLDQ